MCKGRDDDDFALLEAWRRGDRVAGAVLFERHYECVARFFHNKVSEEAQEDLLHDTFEGCLKAVARFRGQARFRNFLFAIARNVLAEHLRRRQRRQARTGPEVDLEETPAADFGLSPVGAAIQHEEQRLLLEALRHIPLIHQITLELHYWEELTTEDIAEVLGIPVGTVRARLRDGRAHLQEQIRKIASSPEMLESTLDNLDEWARRVRDHLGANPVNGGRRCRTGGVK